MYHHKQFIGFGGIKAQTSCLLCEYSTNWAISLALLSIFKHRKYSKLIAEILCNMAGHIKKRKLLTKLVCIDKGEFLQVTEKQKENPGIVAQACNHGT